MESNKVKAHITDVVWFSEFLKEKKNISESTIHLYCEVVTRFIKTNPNIDNLEDYNNFIIKYSIKKRLYSYYSALKMYIEFKITDNNLKNKILESLIKPKMYSGYIYERKYLGEDEILNVINSLQEEKHRIIAIIQTITGVRAGDILRLKRDNIMPEEYNKRPVLRLNIIGKGKKHNVIFIHDEIAQDIIMHYITTHFGFEDYYFIEMGKMKNRQGTFNNQFMMYRMNYMWYWQDLKQALQSNGLNYKDFATHDMRRCFARRVWERYKDIHVLQKLLNHANPSVTLRYLEQSGLQNIDYSYEMQMSEKK
jgi:integrase